MNFCAALDQSVCNNALICKDKNPLVNSNAVSKLMINSHDQLQQEYKGMNIVGWIFSTFVSTPMLWWWNSKHTAFEGCYFNKRRLWIPITNDAPRVDWLPKWWSTVNKTLADKLYSLQPLSNSSQMNISYGKVDRVLMSTDFVGHWSSSVVRGSILWH